jgi:hypothetical protein
MAQARRTTCRRTEFKTAWTKTPHASVNDLPVFPLFSRIQYSQRAYVGPTNLYQKPICELAYFKFARDQLRSSEAGCLGAAFTAPRSNESNIRDYTASRIVLDWPKEY